MCHDLAPEPSSPNSIATAIAPNLRPGKTLMFAHASIFAWYHQTACQRRRIMIAPKLPATASRSLHRGRGTPAPPRVEQDAPARRGSRACVRERELGCTRARRPETTFTEETETIYSASKRTLWRRERINQSGIRNAHGSGLPARGGLLECSTTQAHC